MVGGERRGGELEVVCICIEYIAVVLYIHLVIVGVVVVEVVVVVVVVEGVHRIYLYIWQCISICMAD